LLLELAPAAGGPGPDQRHDRGPLSPAARARGGRSPEEDRWTSLDRRLMGGGWEFMEMARGGVVDAAGQRLFHALDDEAQGRWPSPLRARRVARQGGSPPQ